MRKLHTLLVILSVLVHGNALGSDTLVQKFHSFITNAVGKDITGAAGALITPDTSFIKTYGYAHLDSKKPVTEQSIFRIGSVSKIFTALAIMQLEEKGLLAIDDPVSIYIEPGYYSNTFSKEITIFHLLTHTAGFGENYLHMGVKKKEDALNISSYLQKKNLHVQYEPASIYSYSNFGYTLLGLIIEKVSKKDFSNYIHENILVPLEMTNTYFEPPVAHITTPYRKGKNSFIPLSVDYLNILPAGGLWSNIIDLNKFLHAIIYQNRLLQPATFEKMKQRKVRFHKDVKGFGLSLFEFNTNEPVFFGHGGGWRGYNAYIMFNSQLKTGYIVATNTENPHAFVDPLAVSFIKWAAPVEMLPVGDHNFPVNKLKEYAGTYFNVRTPLHDKTSWMFRAFINKEKKVRIKDQTIFINDMEYKATHDSLLLPVKKDEPAYTIFSRNNKRYIYSHPTETYEKISFFKSALFIKFLLLLMLASGMVSLIHSNRKKKHGIKYRIDFQLSIIILLFLIGYLSILLINFESNLFYGYSYLLQSLGISIYLLLLIRLILLLSDVVQKKWRTVSLLSLFVFTFCLSYLNII